MVRSNQTNFGWVRGKYQELRLDIPEQIEEHHKAAAELAKDQWEQVRVIVWDAQRRGLLPVEYQHWDDKRRGEGVTIDLYAFSPIESPKLVLVQVRRVYRRARKHFLNVKKKYIVTDGHSALEVPSFRIKRAAKLDPSPDSPLRAVKANLPAVWRQFVGEELRLPGPPPSRWWVVYKVVVVHPDGTLRSLYLPSFVYKLGKLYSEKARPGHGGGFYAYLSSQEALEFAQAWGRKYGAEKVAILKCMARGGPVRYDNGKLAFSQLRPLEIIGVLDLR